MSSFETMSFVSNPHSLHLFKQPNPKKQQVQNSKLAELETILRNGSIKQADVIGAPQTSNQPTMKQSALQRQYGMDMEDRNMNRGPLSTLGNYSSTTSQNNNNSLLESTRAMDLQSLNSQDDLSRIQNTNNQFAALGNQFSLHQIEHKAMRKYKKSNYNKMSQQYM